MSYSNLINTNLNLAFRMLKDLAVDATLLRHQDVDFNFATGTHPALLTQIPIKIIEVESEKKSQEHNTVIKTVMIRNKELNGDINALDKISIGGVVWRCSNIMKSDGYITMAAIAKEV
jgi:hypothetical protein